MVSIYPNNLAIKFAQGEFNYQELNRKANQIAHCLLDQDAESNGPVAIYLKHSANPIIAMMGVLKAGKAFVPLNPNLPDERNIQVLRSSGIQTLLTDEVYFDKLSKLKLDPKLKIINIDKLSPELLKINPKIKRYADNLIAIIFTSGSLGLPKGVMHVDQTLLHNSWVHTDFMNIRPEDRHILFSHLSYISGLTDILRTLLNGASLFPIDFHEVGLKGLSDILQNDKITIYHSVPTIFRRLLEEQASGISYPSVRIIHLGGETVFSGDITLMRKYFSADCLFFNNLGSTEVPTYRRFAVTSDMKVEDERLPVGYPVSDKKVFIVDEDGNELGAGEVGEIVIETEYMSWGYFEDPEKTKTAYRPTPKIGQAGRFYSGDIGVIHQDGIMEFLGRKDHQVKIHGNRVELGEVEAQLLAFNSVHQAVVVAKKYNQENILVAYIITSKGSELNIEDIRQKLFLKLPVFMLPKEFIVMNSFPYTQTNKVDRNALPSPNFDKELRQDELVLPKTEIEIKLTKIWQKTLKVSAIGITDNFFALGGDSLSAVNLFLAIEDAFGVKLPISILLEAGDIKKQADILNNTDYIVDWSPIIEVQPLGSKPPLFCLFGKGGNPLTFRQFSEYFGLDQPVYFLQARGLSGRETPLNVVENIAADFIREIQKVYPNGPYRFCGASFGGTLSFEIAKQLKAENEIVDLVVLLDTYGPGYPKFKSGQNKFIQYFKRSIYYLNKHLSNLLDSNPQERKNYFRYYRDFIPEIIKEINRKINEKINSWKAERLLPPELKKVTRANVEASNKYYPSAYNGRVVLLRVSNQPPGAIYDQKLGWGSVDIPNLQIHEVEAHHGSILFEPRVKKVVEILKQYLD